MEDVDDDDDGGQLFSQRSLDLKSGGKQKKINV